MKNSSSSPIVFKIKTTSPKRYYIKPSLDVIPPNEQKEISISVLVSSQDIPKDTKDLFMIQGAILPETEIPQDSANSKKFLKTTWDSMSGNTTIKQRIKCLFHPIDLNSSGIIPSSENPDNSLIESAMFSSANIDPHTFPAKSPFDPNTYPPAEPIVIGRRNTQSTPCQPQSTSDAVKALANIDINELMTPQMIVCAIVMFVLGLIAGIILI
eukprot:TRINITY_DN2909_c0_g1_i1.p1 TRINITY_DN2909_c0_g1~~TRINITY_DN2909_c0_g1_i1.p1  ORF type:complete len:248 (+),score=84.44 TRINITY_DN2909_c0_g1_i1:110-745(+)